MSTTGTVGGIAPLPMPDFIADIEAVRHGNLDVHDDADLPPAAGRAASSGSSAFTRVWRRSDATLQER